MGRDMGLESSRPVSRSCYRCNREIILCNGFTLARDLVSGRIPIREHCGLCVTWLEMTGTAEAYLRGLDNGNGDSSHS